MQKKYKLRLLLILIVIFNISISSLFAQTPVVENNNQTFFERIIHRLGLVKDKPPVVNNQEEVINYIVKPKAKEIKQNRVFDTNLKPPVISSINPPSSSPGRVVSITGSNLSDITEDDIFITKGENKYNPPYSIYVNKKLTFIIPTIPTGNYSLSVIGKGGVSNNLVLNISKLKSNTNTNNLNKIDDAVDNKINIIKQTESDSDNIDNDILKLPKKRQSIAVIPVDYEDMGNFYGNDPYNSNINNDYYANQDEYYQEYNNDADLIKPTHTPVPLIEPEPDPIPVHPFSSICPFDTDIPKASALSKYSIYPNLSKSFATGGTAPYNVSPSYLALYISDRLTVPVTITDAANRSVVVNCNFVVSDSAQTTQQTTQTTQTTNTPVTTTSPFITTLTAFKNRTSTPTSLNTLNISDSIVMTVGNISRVDGYGIIMQDTSGNIVNPTMIENNRSNRIVVLVPPGTLGNYNIYLKETMGGGNQVSNSIPVTVVNPNSANAVTVFDWFTGLFR